MKLEFLLLTGTISSICYNYSGIGYPVTLNETRQKSLPVLVAWQVPPESIMAKVWLLIATNKLKNVWWPKASRCLTRGESGIHCTQVTKHESEGSTLALKSFGD